MKDCDKIVNFDIAMDDIMDEVQHEVGSTTDDDPDTPVKLPPKKKQKLQGSGSSKLKVAQQRAKEISAHLGGKQFDC